MPSNFTIMPITSAHAESVSTSRPRSAPNRVKFLCSHGGKILPHPADGRLKYVGGDTRVISVHRHITLHELMKKLTSMYNGEMILKYQLVPDDLDVLVTVKSDEDIRHMIEECDRHERVAAPRLRTFIFPVSPIVMVDRSGQMDRHSLEQRYINACIPLQGDTSYSTFSVSSACSLPSTPPEATTTTSSSKNPGFNSYHGKHSLLTRNHSSPSLCNTGRSSATNQLNPTHKHHQQAPQPHHVHLQSHMSPKPPMDRHPHKTSGPEHVGRMRPTGVGEHYRQQMDHTPSHSHRTDKRVHMYYQKGSTYDDYSGNYRYDRTDSPPSPDVPSSSHRQ